MSCQEPGLGFEIWIDNACVLDLVDLGQTQEFEHIMSDMPGNHELRFVLKNKNSQHTSLDQHGNIIKDNCVDIQDLCFDGIQVDNIFHNLACYQHDFNGTGNTVQDKFYGVMGCNGTVTLKFSTPVYVWVLEHL